MNKLENIIYPINIVFSFWNNSFLSEILSIPSVATFDAIGDEIAIRPPEITPITLIAMLKDTIFVGWKKATIATEAVVERNAVRFHHEIDAVRRPYN